jgi:F0F1-type ATP synthase assembly protein I
MEHDEFSERDLDTDAERSAKIPADDRPPESAPFIPDSLAETTRKSGLAWSAGIVFFGSVAFMLFLGWIADLVLGSSPWGIVGGVVLGSLIGFLQFFRITSQIFQQPAAETPPRTLISDQNEKRNDRFSA